MKNTFTKSVSLVLLGALLLTGQSCRKGGSIEAQRAFQPITLEYWTVFNSPDDYSGVIADYQSVHPNIRVNVKKFRFEEYEPMLLNALAEDRGPDLFSVHNTWVPEYRPKLLPLPSTTTLAQEIVTGTIKKETSVQLRTTRSINEFDLRSAFIEQVYKDVYLPELVRVGEDVQVGNRAIYGLPIAFDTLVLFYNRDLLDNAGIAQPARTWHEFQEQVVRMARFDSQGNILTAGTALGTGDNVPRSVDILATLMMQNGAKMITDDGRVNFHNIPDELRGQRSTVPGEEAMQFYASFANPNQSNYTWNAKQIDGFEAFLQGKVGYFFGYNYHVEQIKALAPKLNFGISYLPQIQGNPQVHFANYWVESVSRRTRQPDAAWDFLQFMTSATETEKFLAQTKKPTARRDLVLVQQDDPDLFIFASQLLTSVSWYNGNDAAAMEDIMKKLMADALAGTADLDDLLKLAAERVQQTLR